MGICHASLGSVPPRCNDRRARNRFDNAEKHIAQDRPTSTPAETEHEGHRVGAHMDQEMIELRSAPDRGL